MASPALPSRAAPTRNPYNLPSPTSSPRQTTRDFVHVHTPQHDASTPTANAETAGSWYSPYSYVPTWMTPTYWRHQPEERQGQPTPYQLYGDYSPYTPSPDLKHQLRQLSGDKQKHEQEEEQQDHSKDGLEVPSALQPFQRPWDALYRYLYSLDLSSWKWVIILSLITFLSGAIDIVVTLMNVELFRAIGKTDYSSLKVAFLAFAIGFGCVIFAIVIQPRELFVSLPRAWRLRHKIKLWQLSGGLLGAIFIALAILVSAKQGVGAFFTALIAGQQALSFFVEAKGLFGLQQLPFNRWKLLGFVVLIIGQLFFQNYTQGVPPGDEAAFIFAGLAAGVCQLFASNINVTLSNSVESYLIAQLISASISTIILSVLFGLAFIAEPYTFPVSSGYYYTWWMWLGGVLGETVITMTTILPTLLGNSKFSIFNIAGQLVLAAIATTTNFLNSGTTYPAELMIIAGVVLGCAGAAIISYENNRLEKQQNEENENEDAKEGKDAEQQ